MVMRTHLSPTLTPHAPHVCVEREGKRRIQKKREREREGEEGGEHCLCDDKVSVIVFSLLSIFKIIVFQRIVPQPLDAKTVEIP